LGERERAEARPDPHAWYDHRQRDAGEPRRARPQTIGERTPRRDHAAEPRHGMEGVRRIAERQVERDRQRQDPERRRGGRERQIGSAAPGCAGRSSSHRNTRNRSREFDASKRRRIALTWTPTVWGDLPRIAAISV